jgi:hypothetical protein
VAHDAPMAVLGLEIGVLGEEVRHLVMMEVKE